MFEQEAPGDALDLLPLLTDELPSLGDFTHPVQAYLNALAPSSRRPQFSALDWIARLSTQVCTAQTMPWQRLRRPHVLKVRGLNDFGSADRASELPRRPSYPTGAQAHRGGQAVVARYEFWRPRWMTGGAFDVFRSDSRTWSGLGGFAVHARAGEVG
jgi:hypothetical protein